MTWLMKPAKPAGALAGRSAAGINLQFLLTERARRAAGIVVERTVDRNAVELVTDLIVVAAANIDDLIPALLVGRNEGARDGRDRRVGVVQVAAAADARRRCVTVELTE